MNYPYPITMPDVQSSADTRRLAINRVGIKSVRYPLQIADLDGAVQPTIATVNLYVELPEDVKGTHMSRFVDLLARQQTPLSIANFHQLLADMVLRLNASAGRIELTFPFFINKVAPISGVASLLDYEVTLVGEIRDGVSEVKLKVVVPVTSLCPCSKEISDYGAHNQRSHITAAIVASEPVWITELIRMLEAEASCELYGLLKRPDEKYVTERAYDNPKFVEDLVRDVASRLNREPRIAAYAVEAENFESIHNHSAYAMIVKGMAAA